MVRCSSRGGVFALRLHLGGCRLRPGARPAPGLPEEARVHPPDQAAPVRARRAADRGRRPVRGHAGRRRPAARPGGGDAGASLRRATGSSTPIRWRTTGGCPRSKKGGTRLPRRVDRFGQRQRRGLRGAGAATPTLDLFDSPTEELARLEVREIIAGDYRQVGVTWDGGNVLARKAGVSGSLCDRDTAARHITRSWYVADVRTDASHDRRLCTIIWVQTIYRW